MADDPTKQPVATEADGAAKPAPEASKSAPADEKAELETLLASYDAGTKVEPTGGAPATPAKEPATAQKPTEDLSQRILKVVEFNEAEIRSKANETVKKAIEDSAKAVKGDLPDSAATLKQARAWLKDTADDDPRIQKAFVNREKDPQTWGKILTALNKEFAKESKRPDAAATEDRDAVTAAVRGSTSTPPPAKEFNVMKVSDEDARKHIQDKYGYTPKF